MRVLHDRKVRKLKRLDERGAEPHKVDDTRSVIRSLSVKIGMAIQVVDKISVTINKIRDEELWPQINELIQGYFVCDPLFSILAGFSSFIWFYIFCFHDS